MDWQAVGTAIAAAYTGLSDGAGNTLRASHAAPPDAPTAPCAVVILRGFDSWERQNHWITGIALYDVLILLAPTADVPRRYAAMLRWITPAAAALSSGIQLGMAGEVSGALVGSIAPSLAGDSPDYAGLPFDSLRVPVRVGFRFLDQVTP